MIETIATPEKLRRDAAHAANRREQQELMDAVPFWDKLQWLEEMHRLALHLQSQDKPRDLATPKP